MRLAAIFGGMGVIWLIATPLAKVFLNKRRYRRAKGTSGIAEAAFAEFEQSAADLASVRGLSESANAYVRRLIKLQKIPARQGVRLIDLFEQATYGPLALTDVQGKEAVRVARALRRELWADATWLRRAQRLWSPAVVLAELRPNGQPAGGLASLRGGLVRGLIPPAARPR